MLRFLLPWLLIHCFVFSLSSARPQPFAMRISCGARTDVHTLPTNTPWFKDFAYTGGIPANATRPSYISPPLKTLRYFPLSAGPENCYIINRVPKGHYSVRIFFGIVKQPNFDNEPLFDVSVEGTQICSLKSGWSNHDEQTFAESLVFLTDGSASLCFHSTGHGDPAILAIEILQVDEKAYYFGSKWSQGMILRTATRLNCGAGKPKFDADNNGNHWGGDRFWSPIKTFGQQSDRIISVEASIKQASISPNFYPEALYRSALVSTDSQPDLTYIMDVDPNRNYSIWFHFAEIDGSIRNVGERIFDILINGNVEFQDVDILKLSGGPYTALVLNRTVAVNGRTLTITLQPKEGSHAIINAIEVFEVVSAEVKTSPDEVRALRSLKKALALPVRFGWNGDPCVPQQHPWSGADCQYDKAGNKWVIDGLGLDNQGLTGFLPNETSQLRYLQSINLSGNSIHGPIPASLGTITKLEVLDLSYNSFNGSIPESLGQLTSLRILNLNGNSLSGRVPDALGARLLHRASFNFTDNAGLCGIPGLPACGPHLSTGAKLGIAFGALIMFLLIITFVVCCWKRRQNILRVQNAARDAPYAKARTHLSRDIQMTMHHNQGHTRAPTENGRLIS
ncbi:probable LRR receptor-like serine/threonine-protein kinase At1g07560 [Cucurbita pepo subsp. pepo]|uniref:probable LRR receptor-like serine/threonine-protein kinase At1g07560 n=1 Tax=Cucurbita pepo subsp. pepo TaxID=3664 RepID=UPI000C9D3020|nr:probable LRR receptor-like serine/threonine-protein kinase At1g07560 [Cucurbita pepo subsp. pepo]XP_023520049.1 probable LRR receptor-like serine/threonine-protein kinase At1g07560 [Cucurbita pepo subsp. pepo]